MASRFGGLTCCFIVLFLLRPWRNDGMAVHGPVLVVGILVCHF